MLAHAASHQGEYVANYIMGNKLINEEILIPSCIFIFPEIACVGITEDKAKAKGLNYITSNLCLELMVRR